MAATEALTISRHIDDTVMGVDKRLEGVDEKVQGVDGRVKDIDHMVKGVGHTVKSVDHRLKGVDRKVVSVIKGELRFHQMVPKPSSALYSVRCNADRICDSTSVKSS